MPIYDYVCSACGHRFEVFHGLNETGPRQCPVCEGPVHRAFVPPTILFKGSGWARMDRRQSGASAKRSRSGDTAGEKSGDTADKAGDTADKAGDKAGDGSSGSTPAPSAGSSD